MSYAGTQGPTLISYNLTGTAYEYMNRCLALGILEGKLGEMTATPEIARVVEALHVVLSGGEVDIQVVHKGNPDIKRELDERLVQATKDANEINAKSGFYVTVTV